MNTRAMPRPNLHSTFCCLQFALILATATTAFSQATFPTPSLTGISPLGSKAGTALELTLRGTDLDAPTAILLNERSIPAKSTKPNVLSITLPADLKPALYDLRFVGRYGVSNPRAFEISTLDTVESPGTNTKADKALKVALNSAIQGTFKSGSPHWFTIDAKNGQTITTTFSGRRFDTRTELLATLSAPTGRELARMRDGVLTFTAKADATYRLRLNDLMFRAGDDYAYRVTVTDKPAPARPASPAPPASLTIPATIQSSFLPQGAPSIFDLPFKANDKFIIEVHSHQLDYATDPQLIIENVKKDAAGKETVTAQAEVADAPAITPAPSINITSRDPSYAFEAKADGIFRLSISDAFNSTNPFELHIIKEAPKPAPIIAINATLPKAAKAKTGDLGSANVPRNGIAALEVIAPDRNALSEPIELKATNLPAGVTSLGGFIGKGQSLGYIAFQATADAPAGGTILSGIPQSRFVSFPVTDATKDNLLYRTTGAPALGVSTQASPALIQTEKTDILEVAADAKLEIALKVTRHADFADALKLKALGLIDAAKAPEADIAAKAADGKFTLDVKTLKLAPGDYGFILQGPAKMKIRRNVEELTAAESDVKKAIESQAAAKKQLDAANADATPKKADLVKAATAAQKLADTAKANADKLVRDLTAKAVAKDATFIVYSNPIRIRVKEVAKK